MTRSEEWLLYSSNLAASLIGISFSFSFSSFILSSCLNFCRWCGSRSTDLAHDGVFLACRACRSGHCYLCHGVKHFPALCLELDKFSRRNESLVRPLIPSGVTMCEMMMTHLDLTMRAVKRLKNKFVHNANVELAEVFLSHPHLPHAIIEVMVDAIELGRWLYVVFLFHPRLEQLVRPAFSRMVKSFSLLFTGFPKPLSDPQNWDLSSLRRALGESMSEVLFLLLEYRKGAVGFGEASGSGGSRAEKTKRGGPCFCWRRNDTGSSAGKEHVYGEKAVAGGGDECVFAGEDTVGSCSAGKEPVAGGRAEFAFCGEDYFARGRGYWSSAAVGEYLEALLYVATCWMSKHSRR
ncbi:hypothetical protein F2Q68_00045049 [Brassica cretica]|uniref:Uncharacterized protein n=1 Tax=Brassica cretica TaxID=69181 RepID=A0A8S9LQ64_BRACR|nr:hypothetical protein F2Q68_00045049 [Brassica cretica]